MKSNHGVSMIELVIVMIIMVLLVFFAVFNGSESVEKAEATEIYSEMSNIQKAVNGAIIQKELERSGDDWIEGFYDEVSGDGWYIIYGQKTAGYENSKVRKKLDMDVIKRDYLVNYETGEIMLKDYVKVLGSSVRSYDSVRALVESDKI